MVYDLPVIIHSALNLIAGPTLVFQSLQLYFSYGPGKFFAIVFFGLLLIAITTSITIYEVIITHYKKNRMRRGKTIFVTLMGFSYWVTALYFSDNLWKDSTIFGKAFSMPDFVSGNILFMLTALGCAIFVGFVLKTMRKELSPTPIHFSPQFGLTM